MTSTGDERQDPITSGGSHQYGDPQAPDVPAPGGAGAAAAAPDDEEPEDRDAGGGLGLANPLGGLLAPDDALPLGTDDADPPR